MANVIKLKRGTSTPTTSDIVDGEVAIDKSSKKFVIDGSSYKGKASNDCVIGNWWNHQILKAKKQISPLSGSIKEQVVTLIGEENIIINNKKYLTNHYKLKSKNENLPKDKKLNFGKVNGHSLLACCKRYGIQTISAELKKYFIHELILPNLISLLL